MAKLEAHLSQRTQELERERWQIQQDSARLRARETSLEKERVTSLAKLEDERRMRAETKVFRNTIDNIADRCSFLVFLVFLLLFIF